MQTDQVGNAAILVGGSILITTDDLLRIIGLVGVFIGIAVTVWGRFNERQRNREMKRANDLKERELNAKSRDSS